MPTLLTTSWLATTTMAATDIQACIAEFAETHRTAQTDAAFAAFGTPRDLIDIVYSYVPRALSPRDIVRLLKRGTAAKLYVVGTITTIALSHSACSRLPMTTAQEAAAEMVMQRNGTTHIFAELEVPDVTKRSGAFYVAKSCIKLSDCLSVVYTVGFTYGGTLDYIVVTLRDPHNTDSCMRLHQMWNFYRYAAPPTLRVFASGADV